MTATAATLRTGLRRGLRSFVISLRNPVDLTSYLVGTVIFVVVLHLYSDRELAAGASVALYLVPGALAFGVAFGGTFGVAAQVATEAEDGTLLRLRAVPRGPAVYVAGETARAVIELAFNVVLLLVPATLIVTGLWAGGPEAVLRLLSVLVLGALACIPLGLIIGAALRNPRTVGGWGLLVMGALVASAGIFTPVTALPGWVQVVAQVFPLYWLGLGLRGALLPDGAVVVELGEQWRTVEMYGVLGLWAVAGLLLAPVVLRRAARRQSGSTLAARRARALQRA
jgi:ABC-2 type transport system permease protein